MIGTIRVSGKQARSTHAVFISLFACVILPAVHITGFHQPRPAPVSIAITLAGVLAVWLVLWRVCVARQSPMFLGAAIAAVFLVAFRRPLFGGIVGLVLLLAHVRLLARERHMSDGQGASVHDAGINRRTNDAVSPVTPREWPSATAHLELVDLNRIVGPYVRLLVAVRAIRAAVASQLVVSLTTIPDALISPILAGYGSMAGLYLVVIVGIPLTAGGVLLALFFFKVLRALWAGSIVASWGWFVLSVIVIPWAALGLYLDTSRQDLLDGRVWFRTADFALQIAIFVALAVGTAFVLRRRQHSDFLALLHENRQRDWRTALLQLCGVLWPRTRWWRAFRDRGVRWSLLAFLLEGVAFYPLGSPNFSSARALAVLPPFPASLSPFEGHYVSLAVVVCLFTTSLIVWIQLMFRLSDMARRRARRAALKPADEARRLDERPPVLFLRSFENDQVSLRSASVAPAVRLIDPAFEQAHLEDLLQTCLSLGPVIAVGRPDDVVPPVGVPRLYLRTGEWQDVVIALMNDASVIVVGISQSTGLLWEVEQLTARGHLRKAVFIIPPENGDNRELICDFIRRVLRLAPGLTWEQEFESLGGTLGQRRVVGLTCRADKARMFVSARRMSQVQYEVALRVGAHV